MGRKCHGGDQMVDPESENMTTNPLCGEWRLSGSGFGVRKQDYALSAGQKGIEVIRLGVWGQKGLRTSFGSKMSM